MKTSCEEDENTNEELELPLEEGGVRGKRRKLIHEVYKENESLKRALAESERAKEEAVRAKEEAEKELLRERLLTDVTTGEISYEVMLNKLISADFPLPSENDINTVTFQDIDVSSVAGSSEPQQAVAVQMRDFDYSMLRNPHLCPFSVIGLPSDDAIDETCCSQLFDNDREQYDTVVGNFAAALDLLRSAFFYHHTNKKHLTENGHFRAPFSLWFKELLGNIDWCKTNGYAVTIEGRSEKLSFGAQLASSQVATGVVASTPIRGYCDMTVTVGGEKILLSELKKPFGAFSINAQPNRRRRAISQAYAELQGWLAAESTPPHTDEGEGSATRNLFCVLGMDGITLRVFLSTPNVRTGDELPAVYLGQDGNLSSLRYVRVILLVLTWIAQDSINIDALPKMGAVFADTSAADGEVPDCSDPQAHSSSTEDSSLPPQRQDTSNWGADAFLRAAYMMRRELDEDEFWEREKVDVERLNAILNPSALLPANLARLGARKLTV